jgi:hypothetical protein
MCLEYLSSLVVPANPLYGWLLIADIHDGDDCRLSGCFSLTGLSLWSFDGVVPEAPWWSPNSVPFP